MATYGSTPDEVIKIVQPDQSQKDWSVELLFHLAMSKHALDMLKSSYEPSTYLDDKPLVAPLIERAWREALFVRSKLPESAFLDNDLGICISRLGRITKNEMQDKRNLAGRGDNSNTGCEAEPRVARKKRGGREYTRKTSGRGSRNRTPSV